MVTGRGILSQAIVYGALAALVVALFLGIVIGLEAVLGADPSRRPWLEIWATVVVAMAFEPLRRRTRRLANRLVYGRMAEPYEVLARFSQWGVSPHPIALDRVVRSLAEGTTAARASAWVIREGTLTLAAAWPDRDEAPAPPSLDPWDPPDGKLVRPIVHEDELLGTLTLAAANGRCLLASDERLLEQVASGLGLTLRNARLSERLSREVVELRRSRQRIVAVQVETRRRLERDLHDGVQQRLVAVRLKLGMACNRVASTGLRPLVDELAGEADDAIDALREFAHGIYPPSLEAHGLEAALATQLGQLPLDVTLDAARLGRHPPWVEAAVYFSVLETLREAATDSTVTSARVTLRDDDGELGFDVWLDVPAANSVLDRDDRRLAPHVDRLHALGGTLRAHRSSPGGASIRGAGQSRAMRPGS